MISVVLACMLPGGLLATTVLSFLALRAFSGPRQALEAVTFVNFATVLNSDVFPTPAGASLLRPFMLACCFAAAVQHGGVAAWRSPSLKSFGTALLALALIAAIGSYDSTISLLKLFFFALGSLSCLALCQSPAISKNSIGNWMYSFFCTISMANAGALLLSIGFTPWGFQGIIDHPNALGLFLAINLGWLIPTVTQPNRTTLDLVLLAISTICLMLGSARGPFVAIFVASCFVLTVSFCGTPVWKGRIQRIFLNGFSVVCGLCLVVYLLWNARDASDNFLAFALKNDSSLIESVDDRLAGLQLQSQNIAEHPLLGIGFGIHSNPRWWLYESGRIVYDPWFGLPISASVEKGTILLAMIEENGILGALVIGRVFYVFLKSILSRGDARSLMLFAAALSVNLSEFVLCSVGHIGLFAWLAIGTSLRSSQTLHRPIVRNPTP